MAEAHRRAGAPLSGTVLAESLPGAAGQAGDSNMSKHAQSLKLGVAAVAALAGLTLAGCSRPDAPADKKSTAGNVLDDSVVTVKVKSALMADDRTRGTQFAVTTHKGVVQLSGFVDSADEQARATAVARNVEGVQSVVNDTSIKK